MKYFLIPAFLFLGVCQSTFLSLDSTSNDNSKITPEYHASYVDINHALLTDENVDVSHPVNDVDFNLKDNSLQNSNDVWQRIRGQLTFAIPENNRVGVQRNWYATHPSYLTRVAKRAEPFLYYIVEEH